MKLTMEQRGHEMPVIAERDIEVIPMENTQEGGILHGKSGIGNIEDTPQRAQI